MTPITSQQYRTQHTETTRADAESVNALVVAIETRVRTEKDQALLALARQWDGVPDTFSLVVTPDEINHALTMVPAPVMGALQRAHDQIQGFHRHQLPANWQHSPTQGVTYGMRYHPIESVGLYVPGGRALYPSSVLMNAIPAKLAGVRQLVMTSPPQSNGQLHPVVIAAAQLAGVTHIIKTGGAQAIMALTYGTESVPKVDKIVGPGNKYVDAAKKRVFGRVGIDKPAGPSEVAVWIDHIKWAPWAAWECLAQLEHDPDARAVVVSHHPDCLEAVATQVVSGMAQCQRTAILSRSLDQFDCVLTQDDEDAVTLLNEMACEHVVILSDDAPVWAPRIRHAGTLFLGPYTPVAAGDYMGPNHVLPTDRAARFSSALGVMDFMTSVSTLALTKDGLASMGHDIQVLAGIEGLDAHAQSVQVRLSNPDDTPSPS